MSPLNKLFFGKRYKINYNELRKFISNIGKIDFIELGIVKEEKRIDVEEFKKKYEKFRETVNFYTDAAHFVNREIIDIKKSKTIIKRVILGILYLLTVSAVVYLGWTFGIKNKRPSTDGYMILVYIAAITPLLILAFTPLINMLSKDISSTKGE